MGVEGVCLFEYLRVCVCVGVLRVFLKICGVIESRFSR